VGDARRLDDVRRGAPLRFTWNGTTVEAYEGETIGAALLAAGYRTLRTSSGGEPRGIFCGMGVCFDCVVTVDGQSQVRACLAPVRGEMVVSG
jgi:aerobic-type carbon monoxide dehydrogenase small subunit (CoxS/CutS family)